MPPFLDPDSLKFLAGTNITVTETSGGRQEINLNDSKTLFLKGDVPYSWGLTSNLVQSTITSASNYGVDFLNMNNGR